MNKTNPLKSLLLIFLLSIPITAGDKSSKTTRTLTNMYIQWGVDTATIKTRNQRGYRTQQVHLPHGEALLECALECWQQLNALKCTEIDALEKKHGDGRHAVFTFTDPEGTKRKIIISYGEGGVNLKISVILEGIEKAEPALLRKYLSFSTQFTYIVPAAYTAAACSLIQNYGELIIEIPMESKSLPRSQRKTAIFLQSSSGHVRRTVRKAVPQTCPVRGYTHPLHSIITTDTRIMNIILEEVSKRNRYFFEDSPVRKSVVPEAARKHGTGYFHTRSNIRNGSVEEALSDLRRSVMIIEKKGYTVIKAVMTREFLEALKEIEPELKKRDIRFSFPSNL